MIEGLIVYEKYSCSEIIHVRIDIIFIILEKKDNLRNHQVITCSYHVLSHLDSNVSFDTCL